MLTSIVMIERHVACCIKLLLSWLSGLMKLGSAPGGGGIAPMYCEAMARAVPGQKDD